MDFYKYRIRPLIKSCGKSEMEIERDLNLPRSTIYNWNNGRSKSYKKYIPELSTYFNVSADYLLGKDVPADTPAASESDELLARLSDPKFRELVQILSTASDKDLDLLIELARRIDINK